MRARTRARERTRTHTQRHARTHERTHAHTNTLTSAHTNTHAHMNALTNRLTRAHGKPHAHADADMDEEKMGVTCGRHMCVCVNVENVTALGRRQNKISHTFHPQSRWNGKKNKKSI